MKKYIILSALALAVVCAVILMCHTGASGGAEGTQSTAGSTQSSTSAQTAAPADKPTAYVLPKPFPDAPEGCTESVRYDFGTEGLIMVKSYLDKSGFPVQEHRYTADSTLGILCPTAIAMNKQGNRGNVKEALIILTESPMLGLPSVALTAAESRKSGYTHELRNAEGAVLCYVNEQRDTLGRTASVKYYSRSGKLTHADAFTYENGVLREFTRTDGSGAALITCRYNEDGNVTSAEVHGEDGVTHATVEYSGSGVIEHCTVKGEESATTMIFNGGRLTLNGEKSIYYHKNGVPSGVTFGNSSFVLDEQGLLTSSVKNDRSSNGYIYNKTEEMRFYDELGRIEKITVFKNGAESGYTVYTYGSDGSYTAVTYGQNGRESVLKADYCGRTTYDERFYTEGRRSLHTYEYDSLGNITKHEYHEKSILRRLETYTFGQNGELAQAEFSLYGESAKLTSRTVYEYAESGYTMAEYDGEGRLTSSSYFSGGRLVNNAVYTAEGKEETFYEYHAGGELYTVSVYVNGEFTQSRFYGKDGYITQVLTADGQGVLTSAKYVWRNGAPAQIDLYIGGRFTSYSVLEYYSYVSEEENVLKSMYTYDGEGVPLHRLEYLLVREGSSTKHELRLEEKYENGVLTEYLYAKYNGTGGPISEKETFAGGVLTKSRYVGGVLAHEEIYRDGKPASVYEAINNYSPTTYAETFYGEDGRITHTYTYSAHNNTREIITESEIYEYASDGSLLKRSVYTHNGSRKLLSSVKTYCKEGWQESLELLEYDTAGDLYTRKLYRYNEAGLLVHSLTYNSYSDELSREEKNEYYENGVLKKKTQIRYMGVNEHTSVTLFDEAGREIYSMSEYMGRKNEAFSEYDENGIRIRYDIYINGILQK